MNVDQQLKDLLTQANLYGLLAKRYEYVDPQKHMHYYQLHFKSVMQVEEYYMHLQGHNPQQMMPGQHPGQQAGQYPGQYSGR